MLISELHDLNDAVQWCKECKVHEDGKCDGCHNPFVAGERIYRSQSYHYHPGAVNGVSGTRAVQKELCIDCYRKDHAEVYPNQEVPDLPDRGVDANYHAAQRTERKRQRMAELISLAQAGVLTPEQAAELNAVVNVGLRFQ